ncbi:hypothetical protein [Aquicoccus sp. SU-CL01552]
MKMAKGSLLRLQAEIWNNFTFVGLDGTAEPLVPNGACCPLR